DLFPKLFRLGTGLDDPLGKLVFQVDEYSRQTQSKGPRLRPVDSSQEFFSTPAFEELQVAVFFQPAIEIEPAAKTVEAVIGDDHQQRVGLVALRHRPADQIVHATIEVLDRIASIWYRMIWPGGVRRVDISPEHVLQAVGAVEH